MRVQNKRRFQLGILLVVVLLMTAAADLAVATAVVSITADTAVMIFLQQRMHLKAGVLSASTVLTIVIVSARPCMTMMMLR